MDTRSHRRLMSDSGQTLLHYELQQKLGDNLYQARDAAADRTVALRILPPAAQASLDLDRYQHDLKIAASLDHPYIVRIYEIAKCGDSDCIAMEYVPGKTLAGILAAPLPLADALRYARQIAAALQAAHSIGLTHRSLSPANILIADTGDAKVSGFGMAPAHPRPDRWLSPEQAEARGVDARSDIFAFGRVLEAMAGDAPQLHEVIDRCTRSQPARRYPLMEEVQAALEKSETAPAKPAFMSRRRRPAIAAAAIVLAVGGFLWWNQRSRPQPADRVAALTSDAGLTCDPAISRDGRLLAYASDRSRPGVLSTWAQPLAGGAATQVTRGQDDDVQPDFSPDGSQIAFRSEKDGGGVYVVAAQGGEPRLLAKDGRNPRFSPDGRWIAYWMGDPHASDQAGIYLVASTGGDPLRIQSQFSDARYPLWAPDGKRLLFAGASKQTPGDWFVVSVVEGKSQGPAIRTGARTVLGMQDVRPSGAAAMSRGSVEIPEAWAGDSILFSGRMLRRDQPVKLMQVPISPSILQITGAAHQLTFGLDFDSQPAPAGEGRVAFTRRRAATEIWSLPLDGQGEPRRLTENTTGEAVPSISRDGARLVFRAKRANKIQYWLKDLANGKEIVLADAGRGGPNRWLRGVPPPVISPAGDKVAYVERGIFMIDLPEGKPQRIRRFDASRVWGWSSDGTRLLIQRWGGDLAIIHAAPDDDRQQNTRYRFEISWARFSPDDQWIALVKQTEGHRQIMIAPFRDKQLSPSETWVPVTEEDGDAFSPAWSADGRMIYFIADDAGFRCIWGQRVDRGKPQGERVTVRHLHHARYSLLNAADPVEVGLAAARDKLVFGMAETTGNIFLLPRAR